MKRRHYRDFLLKAGTDMNRDIEYVKFENDVWTIKYADVKYEHHYDKDYQPIRSNDEDGHTCETI